MNEIIEDIYNSYVNGNFTQGKDEIKEAYEGGVNPLALAYDETEDRDFQKWVAKASLEVLAKPENKLARKGYYENR